MRNNPTDRHYRIDVRPYAESPWAPTAPGMPLRWAWRIVDKTGQPPMVGSYNLSEQKMRDLAAGAVTRLKGFNAGNPAKINSTLKRKGKSKTNVDTSYYGVRLTLCL